MTINKIMLNGTKFTQASANLMVNATLDVNGALWLWGEDTTWITASSLSAISCTMISTGITHTILLRQGVIWVFGNNDVGQLGSGTSIVYPKMLLPS